MICAESNVRKGSDEMAGSHIPEAPASPFSDPILNARIEAIRQLADGLSDRVAVMDRQFTCRMSTTTIGPDKGKAYPIRGK